ncbi:SUKH-4 family immunity protein [Kribbella sp. C-35]|uniref:SUKH-4 family immunity protein n=1 Tax=Kribbella sp. C-35 TaxID=2789276 RepID=UPI00397A0C80
MANQQQLVDLFGASNITCLDAEDRELFASAGIVADELFDVGLPDKLSGVFVLEAATEPEAFDGARATLNGDEITFVTLGAPHPDSALRYYLNPLDGRVLLAELHGEQARLETVNESLGSFVDYLYRIGRFKAFRRTADDDQQADYKDLLIAYLTARDPRAYAEPDNWWPLAVDNLSPSSRFGRGLRRTGVGPGRR